eukprot:763986-Hanusia_phi.AAC.5
MDYNQVLSSLPRALKPPGPTANLPRLSHSAASRRLGPGGLGPGPWAGVGSGGEGRRNVLVLLCACLTTGQCFVPHTPPPHSLRPSPASWQQPPCLRHPRLRMTRTEIKVEVSTHSTVRGVLFDVDGTLCDSDPVHFEVFQELLMKEGINNGKPIDEHFFRTMIAGRQNALICKDLFPHWSVEQAERWSEMKEARFRELAVGKLKPIPGLEEVFSLLDKAGIKKAAVTNAPRKNAEFMLSVLGRLDWFDTIVIGDECEKAKPDPMPYQIAMQRLGLRPEETVVVEDSPSGATAGVQSGAFTVGILTSQEGETLTGVRQLGLPRLEG